MGAKASRNNSQAIYPPRVRNTENNDVNSPNNRLPPNSYQNMRQNDFRYSNHDSGSHQGIAAARFGGSTRIAYNNTQKSDNFNDSNDVGFRNNFFDGTDMGHLRLAVAAVSSKSRPPISKSTLLQELLECPICMNLYENPHVLPCQHTFCKKCLVAMQNNESNLKTTVDCPICRTKHNLPKGIDGLAANYTMKRLIELDAMAAEKEKSLKASEAKAKCFICQKYSHLKVCIDCSYMLCNECLEDPNHEILIESKLISRKSNYNALKSNAKQKVVTVAKPPLPKYKSHENSFENYEVYSEMSKQPQQQRIVVVNDDRLKLILLCHSSIVELNQDKKIIENEKREIYEDEHGTCKTFSKIIISINDRVISLKKIVEAKFGISCKDQILVYKDKILKSDLKQMNSFNIRQYSRIHIFDERDIKANANDIGDDLYGIYQDADLQINESIPSKKEDIMSKSTRNDTFSSSSKKSDLMIANKIKSESKSANQAAITSRSTATSSTSSIASNSSNSINNVSNTQYEQSHRDKKFKRNIKYQTTAYAKYPPRTMRQEYFGQHPAAEQLSYLNNRNSAIYGSTKNFNQYGFDVCSGAGGCPAPMINSHSRYRNVHEIFNSP